MQENREKMRFFGGFWGYFVTVPALQIGKQIAKNQRPQG
jgi:hypothetical protein